MKYLVVTLAVLIIGYLAFSPSQIATIDEANYYGNAELLIETASIGQSCDFTPGQFPSPAGDFCVFKYNIGTSLFLLPAAATGSLEFALATSFIAFIISGLLFARILFQLKLPLTYSILFLFYPSLIYSSRTILSESFSVLTVTAAVAISLEIWRQFTKDNDLNLIGTASQSRSQSKLKRNFRITALGFLLGTAVGLGVLVRYSNALIFILLGLGTLGLLIRNHKSTLTSKQFVITLIATLLAGLPHLLAFLSINTNFYGGPLDSGYVLSGEQELTFDRFLPQLFELTTALNLVYPLMLFFPIAVAFQIDKTKRNSLKQVLAVLLAPVIAIILLYAAGPNSLFDGDLVDYVVGTRFLAPVVPLLLLAAIIAWEDKYPFVKTPRWLQLFVFGGLAGLSLALQLVHARFLATV